MQNVSSAKDDMNRQILSATESLIDMNRQILSATESLIAEIGIQNLSMRKIATQAGIALGTLYLYFKTKDDLLNKLAYDLFDRFHCYVTQDYDENEPFFNQYRKMFENKLAFLRDNPTVATNLSQYQAMLGFNEIIERTIDDENFIWNKFVRKGQQAGVIAKLPAELLHILGIGTVIELCHFLGKPFQQIKSNYLYDLMMEKI